MSNSKNTKKDGVAAAQDALQKAIEAHQREEQRLASTENEIERLTDAVENTDPDDDAAFSKLVSQRDAARGRIEALTVRSRKAEREIEIARSRVEAAEKAARQAELADIDAQMRKIEQEQDEEATAYRERTASRCRKLQELALAADQVHFAMNPSRSYYDRARGSYWAKVEPGNEFKMSMLHPREQQASHVARTSGPARLVAV